jgi:glycosyltransferase involved in cell wall biosynthesis
MTPLIRNADYVVTTTPATCRDVHQYFGVSKRKLLTAPFFIEFKQVQAVCLRTPEEPYFAWCSNMGAHKNHLCVVDALREYYSRGGTLTAFLLGVGTEAFAGEKTAPLGSLTYPTKVRAAIAAAGLSERIIIGGELTDLEYGDAIARSRFVLTANLYDNGSFSNSDAVQLGRPCLCSAYPAQQYIDQVLGLNARWFDPHNPRDLARALLEMESAADSILLPSEAELRRFTADELYSQWFELLAPRMEGWVHAYR